MSAFEVDKNKKEDIDLKIEEFKKKVEKTFRKELEERGCIGSISELYDSKPSYKPGGTPAQAWSISEVLRISYEYKDLL